MCLPSPVDQIRNNTPHGHFSNGHHGDLFRYRTSNVHVLVDLFRGPAFHKIGETRSHAIERVHSRWSRIDDAGLEEHAAELQYGAWNRYMYCTCTYRISCGCRIPERLEARGSAMRTQKINSTYISCRRALPPSDVANLPSFSYRLLRCSEV